MPENLHGLVETHVLIRQSFIHTHVFSFTEKHLNMDISCSDDGFSTDADSLWSCDSGSVSHFTHQDAISINSSDYDSAICSPQSRTLDRDFAKSLTLVDDTQELAADVALDHKVDMILREEVDGAACSTPRISRLSSDQQSTDTILCPSDLDEDSEDLCRSRSSTIKEQS